MVSRLQKGVFDIKTLSIDDHDQRSARTEEELHVVFTKAELTVDLLSQHPAKNKRKSFNYLWHINSIALFYSIPVVQLVITYQRVNCKTINSTEVLSIYSLCRL